LVFGDIVFTDFMIGDIVDAYTTPLMFSYELLKPGCRAKPGREKAGAIE
jgi:hypothetical protein